MPGLADSGTFGPPHSVCGGYRSSWCAPAYRPRARPRATGTRPTHHRPAPSAYRHPPNAPPGTRAHRPDAGEQMTTSVYVTSPEGHTGKSSVALGLVEAFARRVQRVGVFRPISRGNAGEPDSVLHLLVSHATEIGRASCREGGRERDEGRGEKR